MNNAALHSAGLLNIELFVGKFRLQRFVFSDDFDVTGFTWQLLVKTNPGDRLNVISLTLGNGLAFPIYEDNVIEARFESVTTSIGEGDYYWQLIRTDTNEPWLNGKAKFSFGPLGSQGTTQEATISLVDQEITVSLSNVALIPADIQATLDSLAASVALKLDKLITTNRQIASYTLALTDREKLVEMDVGSANNLTVPLNSTIAFPVGVQLLIAQYGAGQTTVVATGGVTIRSSGGKLKLTGQYSGATLIKIATDEWYLFGDIAT